MPSGGDSTLPWLKGEKWILVKIVNGMIRMTIQKMVLENAVFFLPYFFV